MSGGRNIIVVGAGLAGLCCARALQQAGHTARVFEASDDVGGRARTDVVNGFRLDRGFHRVFTAYPAIQQEINLESLRLRPFDPGAFLCANERRYRLADPFRNPAQAFSQATSPLFDRSDSMKAARLRAALLAMSNDAILAMPDCTTEAYLHGVGFSANFLDNFIRPFFGGIFLESELTTSAPIFAFLYKMLCVGQTALPEEGIGAISRQIADDLLPGTVHLDSPVQELLRKDDRILGIRLDNGEAIEAETVIVATEAEEAARLTGLDFPMESHAVTCLYFALPEPLYLDPLPLLFLQPEALVHSVVQLTNVAPSYAPPDEHLLAVTLLGEIDLPIRDLTRHIQSDLSPYFPKANPAAWELLRVYRIRSALFAQPVGIRERRPATQTELSGLLLAGDYTAFGSLHGALVSGRRAAEIAIQP